MKLSEISRKKLKDQLEKSVGEKGLTYSEIARRSKVHSSQVSRICRGDFKTLSANVVQVCKAVGVNGYATLNEDGMLSKRLQRAVLGIWRKTPDDAARLIRFFEQLQTLRRS